MDRVYTVEVNGQEIQYGAMVERSRFTADEWVALCHEMVKENDMEKYQELVQQNNQEAILAWGNYISLDERYEALLELLPQSMYSKGGTHPKWVADAVDEHTLDKGITQDDVATIIEDSDDIYVENQLNEYFGLDEEYYKERNVLSEMTKNNLDTEKE